jgi:hypothetical protein
MKFSKRKIKAIECAEEVCRAYRTVITKNVVEVTQKDWDLVLEWLRRWMDNSGKHKFDKPKKVKIRKTKDGEN